MKLRQQTPACIGCWIERLLWVVGCALIVYCVYTVVQAAMTQGKASRILERDAKSYRSARISPQSDNLLSKGNAAVAGAVENRGTKETVVGRLSIPRIGLSAMVLEGDDARTLRVGLGHIPGTAEPGQPGNVGIAGHRDTFLRRLRVIGRGDEVLLQTAAITYRYQVSSIEVVEPQNVSVLSAGKKDELTLVTCYPFSYFGPAPRRFIVHAAAD